MGGLARRANYLQKHSHGTNNSQEWTQYALILDAGDFSAGPGQTNQLKTEYLLTGFNMLGYDAINLGERDFIYGARFVLEMRDKYKIPFVSANVYEVDSGKTFVRPYIIKSFAGKKFLGLNLDNLKVGIFGLTMRKARLTSSEGGPELEARDPIEIAKTLVGKLDNKADLIICLAHLGLEQAQSLAAEVPEIDVIIAGHGPGMRGQPLKVEETVVVKPGSKGQYVGDLTLALDKHKRIIEHKGVMASLDAAYRQDVKLASLVSSYKRKVSKIKNADPPRARVTGHFAGVRTCKGCHTEQYNQWMETLHAHATEALTQKNSGGDPECLACHTTGYRKGGYLDIRSTPHLANIQCEVCHGAQYVHVQEVATLMWKSGVDNSNGQASKLTLLPKVTEETCVQCHTSETDPEFSFELKVKKVAH